MKLLAEENFPDGILKYTATVGTDEARAAFLQILRSSGLPTDRLQVQIVDGGSAAMELVILACCGPAGSQEAPLMLLDAAYANYRAFAERLGRKTISINRRLGADGCFALPDLKSIEACILNHRPGALLVIPYDNPTGHFYDQGSLLQLARLCVKHDLWLISDEAYRELFFTGGSVSSIWAITEEELPGITGRRISIETASKVWNACGLRIGALITDHLELHQRSVAEYTANLSPNSIGQALFAALAEEPLEALQAWYAQQRAYYRGMLERFSRELKKLLPKLIISRPDASLYSVVDVRELVSSRFDAQEFVLWCASEGAVEIDGEQLTLLVAPMAGFYAPEHAEEGRTQMRIAFVEQPKEMAVLPRLFSALLLKYLNF